MVFGGRPLVALRRSLPGTFSASADFSSAGWAVNETKARKSTATRALRARKTTAGPSRRALLFFDIRYSGCSGVLRASCHRIAVSSGRLWLPLVQATRPDVRQHRYPDAPGDRDDQVVADLGSGQQAAQRLVHRGERLVLGEPADPRRQRAGWDEPAAEERQEDEEHRGVARG